MIALALTFALAQEDAVLEAAKTFESAKNYSFKGESLMEMPDFGGGGEEPVPQKFEGKHDADIGTTLLTDTQEIVRYKGHTATRPRAEWRVQPEEGDEGGGRRGGGRRGMMGRMGGGARTPQEDLAGLGDKFKSVEGGEKKETVGEDECTLYEAELTEDAAMALFGGGGRGLGRMTEEAEFDGEMKIWIDNQGRIARYETKVAVFASTAQGEFEMTATRTVTIYAVGETKVEIPDGAKDAIDGGDF